MEQLFLLSMDPLEDLCGCCKSLKPHPMLFIAYSPQDTWIRAATKISGHLDLGQPLSICTWVMCMRVCNCNYKFVCGCQIRESTYCQTRLVGPGSLAAVSQPKVA